MDFIIYTYDNVEMVWRVLNGVATIMKGGDPNFNIQALLKLLGMLGFIVALGSMLLKPGSYGGFTWVINFMVVYSILMAPVANVAVINKGVKPGASVSAMTVSNVPIFLAFVGSLTSTIGTKITDSFETIFTAVGIPGASNPIVSYNKYSDSGVAFNHQAIIKAQEAKFNQPDIEADIYQFINNCTTYDIGDTYTAAALSKVTANTKITAFNPAPSAPNKQDPGLWKALSYTNPAHVTTYIDSTTGEEVLADCGTAWTYIDGKMLAAGEELVKKYYLFMSGKEDGGVASGTSGNAAYSSALAMANIGASAMDVKEMLLHTATVNSVRKGFVNSADQNNAGGMLLALADAQAVASTNSSFIIQAKLAEQALPMIRNAIEAILYAVFPIVVFLCFLLTGNALITAIKGYVFSFIWIQLWAPIYSIINYLGQVKLGRTLIETGRHSDGTGGIGISMETYDSIYSGVISDQAIIGWLTPMVPVIASAIIHGMNQAVGQLSGGSFISGAGRASEAAGSGNVQMGNVSAGQQNLGPTVNSAFKETYSDAHGTTISNIGANGSELVSGQYMTGITSRTIDSNGDHNAALTTSGEKVAETNTLGISNDLTTDKGHEISKASKDGELQSSTVTKDVHKKLSANEDAYTDEISNQKGGPAVAKTETTGSTRNEAGHGTFAESNDKKYYTANIAESKIPISMEAVSSIVDAASTNASNSVTSANSKLLESSNQLEATLSSQFASSYTTSKTGNFTHQVSDADASITNGMAEFGRSAGKNLSYGIGASGGQSTSNEVGLSIAGSGATEAWTGTHDQKAAAEYMAGKTEGFKTMFSSGKTVTEQDMSRLIDAYAKQEGFTETAAFKDAVTSVEKDSKSLQDAKSWSESISKVKNSGENEKMSFATAIVQKAHDSGDNSHETLKHGDLKGWQDYAHKHMAAVREDNCIVKPDEPVVNKNEIPKSGADITTNQNTVMGEFKTANDKEVKDRYPDDVKAAEAKGDIRGPKVLTQAQVGAKIGNLQANVNTEEGKVATSISDITKQTETDFKSTAGKAEETLEKNNLENAITANINAKTNAGEAKTDNIGAGVIKSATAAEGAKYDGEQVVNDAKNTASNVINSIDGANTGFGTLAGNGVAAGSKMLANSVYDNTGVNIEPNLDKAKDWVREKAGELGDSDKWYVPESVKNAAQGYRKAFDKSDDKVNSVTDPKSDSKSDD